MRKFEITVKGENLLIKEKKKARIWEFNSCENWEAEIVQFFSEFKASLKIELFLGEEYFKIRRVLLEKDESIKERIEEEKLDEIERKVWRSIKNDKNIENRSYLLISISEYEVERLRKIFDELGHKLIFLSLEFLKEKRINFIKLPNKRIYIIISLILIEIVGYIYLNYRENIKRKDLIVMKGRSIELKNRYDELQKELKNKKENEQLEIKVREKSKALKIVEILKSVPERIYLESWEFTKDCLKIKGIGNEKELYEWESFLLRKEGIKWGEIEYMKKSERGYQFSIEIFF